MLRNFVQDDQVIVIDNRRSAGQIHWLILPKEHAVRDIESLNSSHLKLLQAMDQVKRRLIQERCPDIPPSWIHSGYHRGRRPLVGTIFYPDIISIQHLHLHVIIRPRRMLLWFKYPPWLRLMWKSDDRVLREVEKLAQKQM
ncbi:HIT-like domain-containing protein [Trichoderma austrokoningii]